MPNIKGLGYALNVEMQNYMTAKNVLIKIASWDWNVVPGTF